MLILDTCTNISILGTILFLKKLVKIISIIVPILLVLLITIDFAKAVIADSDDDMKRAQHVAIKRIIAGLIVFFVPIIIDVSFSLLGNTGVEGLKCYNDANDQVLEQKISESKAIEQQKEQERQEALKRAKEQHQQQREQQQKLIEEAKEKNKTNSNSGSSKITNTGTTYNGKARLNKKYSSTKILDTLTKNNFGIRSTVPAISSAKISQSFAIVGNYYIVNNVNTIHTKAYVVVYDKYTNKKVNSFTTSLGHANGSTYNGKDGNIYVTHGNLSRTRIHKFSASNIESRKNINVKSASLSRGVSGVAYDTVTNKLYYASGNGIYEYSNGSFKHKVTRKGYLIGSSQDFCVHNGIVYDTRVNGGNTIDIYKISGAYLGSYRVKISGHEIEGINYYGEGNKMAVLFNHYGSKKNYIYVIDSIVPK